MGVVAVGNLMVLDDGPRFAIVAPATEIEIIAAAGEAVAGAKLEVADAQANAHSIEIPVDFRIMTICRVHLLVIAVIFEWSTESQHGDPVVTDGTVQIKGVGSLDHQVSRRV